MRVVPLMLAHGRVVVTMRHGRQEATQCPLRTGSMVRGPVKGKLTVSELLRAQLTDTRKECDRWRQNAERLALPPPAPEPLHRPRRRWWQPAW